MVVISMSYFWCMTSMVSGEFLTAKVIKADHALINKTKARTM